MLYRAATGLILILGMAVLLGSGPCACAQSATDGAIAGEVRNNAGKPVAGALVQVQQLDTGLTVRARAGSKGEFLLMRLPVGDYALTVESAGGSQTLSGPVTVGLGEVTEVAARVRSGSLASYSPATSEVTADELSELPVDGGEWRSLTLALPGADGATDADDNAGEVSFRGMAGSQNSSRTDGGSGDESFSAAPAGSGVDEDTDAGSDEADDSAAGVGSGPRSVADGGRRAGSSYVFAGAAVREFRVQGQGDAVQYGSALYGHGAGGVTTAVSRSGGAKLHGTVFYAARDSAWAATNPFSVATNYVNGAVTSGMVKPRDLRQQFGASLGGPVHLPVTQHVPGRLFYFYAFDAQRRSFPAVSSPGYASFYTLTADQTALLANRGVSPAQTMAALNYLDSLTGTVARRADQTVNFARVDWQRKGGSRLSFQYNRARWSSPAGARSEAVVDRAVASLGSSFGKVDVGSARWVQFLTPALSNELLMQYGRQLQYETPQTPLAQEPNIGPGGLPPEVSLGPLGLVFGTPAALGRKAYPDERRFEAADVLAWVKGRHFVQLGGDFSAVHDYTASLTNVEGTFNYDSTLTNGNLGGLADWIADYTYGVNAYPNGGCPSGTNKQPHYFCFKSFSQSFGQQSLGFSTQEWAGFVQDDWRVAQRLTIHAGVRYEYEFLPLPQQPNAALDVVFGSVGATSVYPEDRNNFGPRLGVAWEPFGAGRGVVRLGYGVYFGNLPGATIRTALLDTAMASSTIRVRILPTTETTCPQVTTVSFGYACSFLATPPGVVAATTSAVVFDRRFRLPEVQQATLSIEHGVGWGILGTAGYVMNLDRQLPNSVDINIAPATAVKTFVLQGGTGAVGVRDGETFAVPVYTQRVSTSFGPVTDIVSNANATYNGLTLEARRGLGRAGGRGIGRGLAFRVGWTWSKAIDFGQNAGASPRLNGQFDPFNVRYDKGLSSLDFPHRVVATVIWSPQVSIGASGAGERTLRAVANGWLLAAISSEASGRGYSYDISGGTRLTGGRESINGSGGSVVLPTVGRNTLRLPGTANLDLRLSRGFRLPGERMHLRTSLEAFNVANHVNYSGIEQRAFMVGPPVPQSGTTGPVVTPLVFQDAAEVASEELNVPPFGTYTAASTSQAQERHIQLSLQLEF